MQRALQNKDLKALLKRSSISGQWTGPEQSEKLMKINFKLFERYAYLLKM